MKREEMMDSIKKMSDEVQEATGHQAFLYRWEEGITFTDASFPLTRQGYADALAHMTTLARQVDSGKVTREKGPWW